MQLAINGRTVDEALRVLKPRSSALWACSDRRTIQVATQAPGAVSSDVVSGVCQVVGSSIAKDGVDWTATLAIGPVTEASLLPVLVGSTIVLLLIAGLTALVWIRRARRRSDVRPSEPAPVH
jgi:protein-S-isoprenylcysteine O-methyltransferase Ste14